MDWKALATEQRQQLEEQTKNINTITQHLSTTSRKLADLQFRLAEQAESLSTSVSKDHVSKLQLQLQIATKKNAELEGKFEAADSTLQKSLRRFSIIEKDLHDQLALLQAKESSPQQPDRVAALETALQRSTAETQEARDLAARLKRQLEAANRDFGRAQGFSNDDKDDEEYTPDQRPESAPKQQPSTFGSAHMGQAQRSAYQADLPTRPKSKPAPPKASASRSGPQQKTAAPATAAPAARPSPRKRKRLFEDEIDQAEVEDLRIPDYEPAANKRASNASSFSEEADGSPKFSFNAVTVWRSDGTGAEGFPHEDLLVMGELWDNIQVVRDMWEDAAGQFWQEDFKKKGKKAANAQCVTKKLCGGKELSDGVKVGGGRTQWRSGAEGKHTCRDCVANGWPCFIWYEENEASGGELLLLPLHEQDRERKIVPDFEIRHWLNA